MTTTGNDHQATTGNAAATGNGATTSDAAVPGTGDAAGDGVTGVTGLVDLLTERALALSVQAPRAPSSLRISAGEVQVEICWPAEIAGHAVAGYAVASQSVPAPADPVSHGGTEVGQATPADTFPLCAGTVGTFYRAPEPGAAPFVAEGDRVRPGQQVAIIEAMKLMIPVEAERAGVVVEFLVGDRAPVEYGQPLILLREAGT